MTRAEIVEALECERFGTPPPTHLPTRTAPVQYVDTPALIVERRRAAMDEVCPRGDQERRSA